jgi:hypothetical protein
METTRNMQKRALFVRGCGAQRSMREAAARNGRGGHSLDLALPAL